MISIGDINFVKGIFDNFPFWRIYNGAIHFIKKGISWIFQIISYFYRNEKIGYLVNTFFSTVILGIIVALVVLLIDKCVKVDYLRFPISPRNSDLYLSEYRKLMIEFKELVGEELEIPVKDNTTNNENIEIQRLPVKNQENNPSSINNGINIKNSVSLQKEKIDNFIKKIHKNYINGFVYFISQVTFLYLVMIFKFYYNLEIFNPYPFVYCFGVFNAWIIDMRMGFEGRFTDIGPKRIPVIICTMVGYHMVMCYWAYLSVKILRFLGVFRESRCGVINDFSKLWESRFLLRC